jgi:phosphoserine phosphatase
VFFSKSAEVRSLLENVNKIGREMKPADEDFIFIQLSPYMDNLLAFLKRLNSAEMQMVFMEYEGVMKVMQMMEECAQQMEKNGA